MAPLLRITAVLDKLQALDPNAFQPNAVQNGGDSILPTTDALDNKTEMNQNKELKLQMLMQ